MTDKLCSVENCLRPCLAKGLCNAHYIRKRNGSSLDAPIRRRVVGGICAIANCDRPHYGLNMCARHYRRARWQIRKRELVELCGNSCQDCGQSYPLEVYDFHHRNPSKKELKVGHEMVNVSLAALKAEVEKCDLLCANCHRMRHGKNQEMPS
jgi:hypothetical protein